MRDNDLNAWHIPIRVISCITLLLLAWSLVADKYYPTWSRWFANSAVGTAALAWIAVTSLLLPLSVAFEAWRTKGNKSNARAILIDGLLAAACPVLLVVGILRGFSQAAMF
jgi:hypothetical protein